jgi:hypothetical protein
MNNNNCVLDYGEKITPQDIYDSYNSLIFADDKRVFNKMMKRAELYLKAKDLVGDILEFGVFKGASIALWLKLIDMYEPNSITRILGFDFFNSQQMVNELNDLNKEHMNDIVNRVPNNELTLSSVATRLSSLSNYNRCELIEGNAVATSASFTDKNPGLKIKILYMDLDVGEPTYEVLMNLWEKVCINGLIIFDEYALPLWDESVGVDKFLETIQGKYEQFPTGVNAPTMFIRKIK